MNDKFKTYVGSLLTATSNPETGENPLFGQLAQGSLAPHVEKMRMTATQFAAATGLTVTDVGVINDANPTSSDAILARWSGWSSKWGAYGYGRWLPARRYAPARQCAADWRSPQRRCRC